MTRSILPSYALVAAGLLALVAAEAFGVPVEVTPLGGDPVVGELIAVDAGRVVLRSSGGERSVSAEELPRLQRRAHRRAAEEVEASAEGRAWLVGGSSLPIDGVQLAGESGRVRLTLSKSAGIFPAEIELPLDALASLRLPGGPGGFDQAWGLLRVRAPSSDLIVTPPRGEGSLDYLEGFVESIDDESVTLFLDGQPVDAPRARVYGIVFAAGEAPRIDFQGPRITSAGGVALNAVRLQLASGDVLRVEGAEGFEVALPVASLVSIDFRHGRVIELGELTPTRASFEPQFGTPVGGGGELVRPAYRVNQSYWGHPLRVYDPGNEITESRRFDGGMAVRSGAELVFPLEQRFGRFQATVGVDPDAAGRRELRLEIFADGEVVFDETLRSLGGPAQVDVPVEGARELRLRVERVRGLDASLHLGDARLIR